MPRGSGSGSLGHFLLLKYRKDIYQPDTVAIGNDGGDLVFLMKQEKKRKRFGMVGLFEVRES